ncbi:MAG: FimV/HubP family polar landmark protein [Gallionella sp.]|nr:FimV/HubP family polar landmark protein [Gallionella sp.]
MLKILSVAVGLTLGTLAHAVGLGGINVVSALGQPLKAEIELLAVSKSDKPSLVARLASPDAYKGVGLEYPYGVKYSFQVESRANGATYLKLSSNQEINDPFVSLLVELSWSSGRLMREYTFLLDPPGYVAAQPAPETVQTVLPAVVSPVRLTAIPKSLEEAKPVARFVEQSVERPVEKRVVAAPARAEKASVETGEITVQRGDTLNKIAARSKPDDVSLERMLVALYRANDDQFDGKNMNRIQSGKILRMPDQDEVMNVAQSEAVQEIRAQSADWNAYRQKLAAAAATSRQNETSRQVATGKISGSATDKTPVTHESAKEVLRLSKGELPGDKAGAAGRAAQDKRNSAEEDAIAKSKAVEEGKARAALLESNLKNIERLAQLKAEAAALVAAASVEGAASSVASEVAAASEVATVSAVESAPTVAEEPALLDQLLASPLVMGIGAAVLLALGGLGIALGRRKQLPAKAAEAVDTEGAKTGHLTSPVAPSPDTGDFTVLAGQAEETPLQPEDIDPISEAELFLNFGRDEQAEEVLKDAILRTPDNHQLHLKLLGIYANRKDAAAFSVVAMQLHGTGDADAMRQAAEMGRKLDPDNPLYAEDGSEKTVAEEVVSEESGVEQAGDEEASIEEAGSATLLSPSFGVEEALAAPEELSSADEEVADLQAAEHTPDQAGTIDFDVTAAPVEQTAAVDFEVTAMPEITEQVESVDFDVTSTLPLSGAAEELDMDVSGKETEIAEVEQQEVALPSLDDLIFDVTPVSEVQKEAKAETASTENEGGMEFMLDFPMDDIAETPASPPQVIDLADISLDMDDAVEAAGKPVAEVAAGTPTAEVKPVERSEQWHEVTTKLDLARAYQEMGDAVGAREILDEVVLEGDEAQQREAQLIISQLG